MLDKAKKTHVKPLEANILNVAVVAGLAYSGHGANKIFWLVSLKKTVIEA